MYKTVIFDLQNKPEEELKETLEFLYKRYILALIASSKALEEIEKNKFERYFEFITLKITEDELPNTYAEIFSTLKLTTSQVMIVSDSPENVTFAHSKKIKAVTYGPLIDIKEALIEIDTKNIAYINPNNFRCTQCGQCCRAIVKVSETDIERIEKSGLKRKEFLDYDPMEENPTEKNCLKMENKVCTFLRRKGDRYYCSIYEQRPSTCRKFPFFKKSLELMDCQPFVLRQQEPLENILPDENKKNKLENLSTKIKKLFS
ncbi:YkgJ family cysteine cluster protein [Candidatus Woesearchaeota archaeon]|nr:YkgJ family cysteine cluster protein [Candidatus Woesearchaeota archaeon]